MVTLRRQRGRTADNKNELNKMAIMFKHSGRCEQYLLTAFLPLSISINTVQTTGQISVYSTGKMGEERSTQDLS